MTLICTNKFKDKAWLWPFHVRCVCVSHVTHRLCATWSCLWQHGAAGFKLERIFLNVLIPRDLARFARIACDPFKTISGL